MIEDGGSQILLQMTLPPVPQSIATARQAVKPLLADYQSADTDGLLLLTTELVANAIKHAQTAFLIDLTASNRSLKVTVTDAAPNQQPKVGTQSDPLGSNGRGLVLVDSLSDEWGFRSDDSIKSVWASVTY